MSKLKSKVKKAIKQAKKIEKEPLMTTNQMVDLYKKGFQQAEKLRKLLKEYWFINTKSRRKTKKK